MAKHRVGIIGGTGLYQIVGLKKVQEVKLTTPFGKPSDSFVTGTLDEAELVFLPRHGKGHRILPAEINFRANIFGMKMLGVERLISVGSVGSLREDIAPGHIVIPDQYIDRTTQRQSTFFGGGLVAHVGFADPFCGALRKAVIRAGEEEGAQLHSQGTYVCMEGPQFSTRAESHLYRSWGAHVIGMTTVQEAKLAREAEMCFVTIALATDYDCWNESAGDVHIEEVIRILENNTRLAQRILTLAIGYFPESRACPCASALKDALVTERGRIPQKIRRDLGPVIGKYL